MPNFRQRKWLWIGIAIAVIIILTLVAAPNSSGRKNDSGSTYGRGPDGYGAWYEYMTKKEIPIERWRKPFAQLIEENVQDATYLKILSKSDYLLGFIDVSSMELDWISQGNTLVVIGKYEAVTAAPFISSIPYRQETLSNNQIKIATTRRFQQGNQDQSILQDRYGAVVWQETIGKGKIIYCTTPYLAANAYQDNLDNYQFLADLVDDHQAIWVDEYIHGYKDKETIAEEQQTDILSYLAQTPWFFFLIQTVLIGIVAAISAFRRFGLPNNSKMAIADNSTAYIDALAGVLEKANSTDFVVEAITKDEQRKLQQALGLGKSLVDEETLLAAYKQQRGETEVDLSQLLRVSDASKKISDAQLITWIQKWQKLNQSN
ncbi:DUF4350 domain-containing protein [Pleurocapsa sp. CCALA 161]|uniref:DUF4350 domain-containing protein n=1 Tax=Pleurocapsa sp. CCALA 161 TaxID=2107688 RepID=UPI000D04D112|nr:DUF4350 domain-containing protein [Pleurocapsa sp. CCALA 161]PSB10983.1 DUF4350 domain-containing protein [Pleurocapsa sp. CCALA 161]